MEDKINEIWTWHDYTDSIGLTSPDNKNYFSYDKSTYELKLDENSKYIQTFYDGIPYSKNGELTFLEAGQNYINEKFGKEKNIYFAKIDYSEDEEGNIIREKITLPKIDKNVEIRTSHIENSVKNDFILSYFKNVENPSFKNLKYAWKLAVIDDMSTNIDLIGEYIDKNNLSSQYVGSVPLNFIKERIDHKDYNNEYSYFNLKDKGQIRYYNEVINEWEAKHEYLLNKLFDQEQNDLTKKAIEIEHNNENDIDKFIESIQVNNGASEASLEALADSEYENSYEEDTEEEKIDLNELEDNHDIIKDGYYLHDLIGNLSQSEVEECHKIAEGFAFNQEINDESYIKKQIDEWKNAENISDEHKRQITQYQIVCNLEECNHHKMVNALMNREYDMLERAVKYGFEVPLVKHVLDNKENIFKYINEDKARNAAYTAELYVNNLEVYKNAIFINGKKADLQDVLLKANDSLLINWEAWRKNKYKTEDDFNKIRELSVAVGKTIDNPFTKKDENIIDKYQKSFGSGTDVIYNTNKELYEELEAKARKKYVESGNPLNEALKEYYQKKQIDKIDNFDKEKKQYEENKKIIKELNEQKKELLELNKIFEKSVKEALGQNWERGKSIEELLSKKITDVQKICVMNEFEKLTKIENNNDIKLSKSTSKKRK